MTKLIQTLYSRFFATLVILLITFSSYGSHIVGADLFYTHVSGNTYKITFIAYGDCGPASAVAFSGLPNDRPVICVYDGGTSIGNVSLVIDTPGNPYLGHEITPVCPADSNLTQCTVSASTIPGIKKFVYTGTYTVPYVSHTWRFIYTGGMGGGGGAGRAAAISNIASGSIIQLVDSLDNFWHPNSSPLLTIVPTPFFCLNNPDSYNPGAVDPDGDSLSFFLVPGRNGSASCGAIGGNVTYTGGFTATNPLAVSAGTFSFNQSNGQLNFNPNVTQRALVVYNIEEYRNDTFMGTSQREMTFLVITCSTPPPGGGIVSSTGGGTVVDSTHFKICSTGGAFSLSLVGTESDTSNVMYVTTSGLPSGATFVTTNDSTNHPVSTFSWTTTGVTPGVYTFFVTYTDNNCPISGTRTNAFTITVDANPTIDAGGGATICVGGGILLVPSGGISYTWSPGTGLSCTACASPGASPSVTTLYTVTGTNAAGCSSTDTVRIIVNPMPAPITGIVNICVGGVTTLSDTSAGGTWSGSSSAIATVGSTTGVVTSVSPGTVTIYYALPSGCYVSRNVVVNPLPVAIAGPTSVCVGSTITLTDASGSGTWVSNNTAIATIVSGTGLLTGVSAGTVTITYTLGTGCYITTLITVNPLPSVITGPSAVCVGSVITLADSSSGGTWTSGSSGIATIGGGTGAVTGASSGVTSITYTLPTGCLTTYSVTVNPLPVAIGGPASVCLGASVTLTDATATGSWSSSNNAIATIDPSSGMVTGTGVGSATITYTLGTGCLITRGITVNPIPSTIGGPTAVCAGSIITLTDSASGGTWTSSATGTATITGGTGALTGVASGTVTITYTLPAGCYVTTTITVNPLPAAIGGPASVCLGSSVTLTDATTTGSWSSSNTAIATIDPSSGMLTGNGVGSATITYTLTTGCLITRGITVDRIPGTIGGPTVVCAGSLITLTDTAAGGTWSSAATGTATIVAATGVLTGVASGTVTITYTMPGGCFTTTSITVNPLPATIGGPATVCLNSSITLTDATTTGSWSSSNSSIATIDPGTGYLTGSTVGSATISYTLGTGCYVTRAVTVNPIPGTFGGPTSVCAGTNITLTNTASGGTWTSGSTAIATIVAATGVLHGVAAGTVTITYTMPGGCYATTSITVNPAPNAGIIGGSITVCVGTTVTLTETVTGGTWTSPSSSIATVSSTGVVTGVAAGSAVISYSVTNMCGTAYAIHDMTVYAQPVAGAITGPSTVCVHATISLTESVTGGTWSSGSTGIATVSTTGVVTGGSAGTVTISYSVTNICGTAVATKSVDVLPIPTISISPSTPNYCIGGSVGLSASGAISYTWTPGTALSATTGSAVLASPTVTVIYTVTGTAANGCRDTASRMVVVHPLPIVVVATDTICRGFGTTLSAAGASTYTWSPAATLSSSVGSSVFASPIATTSYTITGTDIYGCVNTTTASVMVNPIPPVPGVTSPVDYCKFAASSALTAAGSNILWYTTATGGVGTTVAPVPSTAIADTTVWYVTQTVNGCESPRDSILVEIFQDAITGFEFTVKYGCDRDTVECTNLSQFASSFKWYFGDGTRVDTSVNPVHYYRPVHFDSTYTIKLYGYNPICFDDSTFHTLLLTPNPNVINVLTNVTTDQTIAFGSSVQLYATGAAIYEWTPSDGSLNNPNINNPVATPSVTTTYYLYGYSPSGCLDTAKVTITVTNSTTEIVPSAFTPNGDGRNDVFRVGNLGFGKMVDFIIYNRWGQEVFHTSDATKGWDGSFNGVPQDLGVYNYVIILNHTDGGDKIYKGTVTLLR